jgi:CO/xanthine dehydrogenase FAD-binding subunit
MDVLPPFDLLRPRTLDEVVKARADHPGSQLLGGGTDLVVNIRRGIVAPPTLIDVNHVAELRAIKADAHALEIGGRGHAERARQRIRRSLGTIRCWRQAARSSPGRPIATWARSAAISASTPAACSITRANGGAPPTTTASRPRATSAMSRPRAAASASHL